MCGCLSHAPHWGPGRQHRHVPWLGIKLETLCFRRLALNHWATSARADFILFYGQVVFHCVHAPQLFYSLIYWWALGLLPWVLWASWRPCLRVPTSVNPGPFIVPDSQLLLKYNFIYLFSFLILVYSVVPVPLCPFALLHSVLSNITLNGSEWSRPCS